MVVSDFMVSSMLKILKCISVECMECLNEDSKKKRKGQVLYIGGRYNKITISAARQLAGGVHLVS